MMCDDWVPYYVFIYVLCLFMYFDMFYIQWHHLAKKDLWNKVYILFYSSPATITDFFLYCFDVHRPSG
jgi:hypothetical protein